MSSQNRDNRGIAVVGASALFPGSVGSGRFWDNILLGRDFMTDVPPDHWLIDDYYHEDHSIVGKTYARRGAFLSPIEFDPMEYGMPPKQLSSTDTAQLLALIVAKKVLEDAACFQFEKVDKKDISVILGIASATEMIGQMAAKIQRPHWVKALRDAGVPESQVIDVCDRIEATYPDWDEATFPGLLGNVVAGRIANRLDLGGTNCVIDAACASSLGAVSMAVDELLLGNSDLVITGGVDALNDIFMYMCFSKTPALSPTGDCRPFSDNADGTMLGEGIGMVALRRLADAERDGDKIYAVLRGLGSSSDGKAKSIYAPRSEGQELAIRRAYERAGYSSDEVELIEAHGTATKAGDVAEFDGLRRAFSDSKRADKQWCALGSIKSQIGHTKAAAGSAALLKAVLALHHKVLPPTIKVERPNPEMGIEQTPFYLNTEARPWVHRPGSTRKASVSSFGFGGSNFHITLEEYAGEAAKAKRFHRSPVELILIGFADISELDKKINELNEAADKNPLAEVASGCQHKFDAASPRRLSILAADKQEFGSLAADARQRISQDPAAEFSIPNRIYYGVNEAPPQVGFLFPGQGSQYIKMGADLAMEFEGARKIWDSASGIDFEDELALHRVVFPIPVFSDEERKEQTELLRRTHWAQPAIGCVSASMLNLLNTLGLRPQAVAGHSYGEISALFAAGVIESPADMIKISRKRGELMTEAASIPGSMTAVFCSATEVEKLLQAEDTNVVIANINSPKQVVIAGRTEPIEQFEKHLSDAGIGFKRLPVATAFHSEIVSSSAKPFGEYLKGFKFNSPSVPVYANTTGEPYPNEPAKIGRQLGDQLANKVLFAQQIEAMYAQGIRLFLEVGPGAVLSGLARDCLKERDHLAISLDGRGKSGVAGLWNALGVLSAQGLALDYSSLWNEFAPAEKLRGPDQYSKATVKLSGTNYGKPYPPENGAAGRPLPNQERQPELASANPVAGPTAGAMAPSSASAPSALGGEWVKAFNELRRQTAEGHAAFQQTMSENHTAFLRASEAAFEQLGRLSGGAGISLPNTDRKIVANDQPGPMPTPTQKPANVAPTPKPQAGPSPAQAPSPPPARTIEPPSPEPIQAKSIDYAKLILEVVAEKTGYPVEMLDLSMELEAGLGIDSIKRVEILSSMQESMPEVGEIDTGKMAALRTLGEILEFVKASAPAPTAPAPSGPVAATIAKPQIDYEALILEVVAEKTGYPVEMLDLSMELEAGLGIDSIKRVEILSSMQESMPEVGEIDTGKMAALRTLGEILEFVKTSAPAPAAAAPSGPPAAPVAQPQIDYEALILEVVAEKTGYPVEMLDLSMELEAGLGIDSIKRVEILSSMQESMPEVGDIDTGKMAALRTLGEILEFVKNSAPALAAPAPTAPAAEAKEEQVDFTALILEVVAEKTGYPVEMLDLSMELEAGLGIDSIKRVEILSTLQEKLPQLEQIDTAKLSTLKTLGEILDAAVDVSGAETTHRAPAPAVETKEPAAPGLERKAPATVDAPAVGVAQTGLFEAGTVYIVRDNRGIAAGLAERLSEAGLAAEVVETPPKNAQAVILLSGLDKLSKTNPQTASQLNYTAFKHATACAEQIFSQGGVFVTVQDTGGDFGLSGSTGDRAWSAGITALAKTASREWANASVKAIDIATEGLSQSEIADRLFIEIVAGGAELEVGLGPDGRRTTIELVDSDEGRNERPLAAGDVVAVSGGARGVTAHCLLELASRVRLSFVILGRTALVDEPAAYHDKLTDADLKKALLAETIKTGEQITPLELEKRVKKILAGREVRLTIEKLEATGSKVLYLPVEIGNAKAVADALAQTRKKLGPIRAVVHAAGVVADKYIHEKTAEQFDLVFQTKVVGLQNLIEATRGDDLKQLVCFSSVAARAGNAGQVDYAMANEVLNRVCQSEQVRRGSGCRVKSIGWGPWEGGMVRPELVSHFTSLGIVLIPLAAGAAFFADEMQGNIDGVELVYGGRYENDPFAGSKTVSEHNWEIWISEKTDPYLDSHRIDGVAVLPVVIANDLCLRLAASTSPNKQVVAVQNLRVLKGIQLTNFNGGGDRLRISCREINGPDHLGFSITSADGVPRYQAEVLLSDERPPTVPPSKTDALATWELDSKNVYQKFLFHGPDFQVIKDLTGYSEKGCSGILERPASSSGGIGSAHGDAVILDGGLQLALLGERSRSGQASLPTGFKSMKLLKAAPYDEPITCNLYCTSAGALSSEWRIEFIDQAGEIAAIIDGLAVHVLPGDAVSIGAAPGKQSTELA